MELAGSNLTAFPPRNAAIQISSQRFDSALTAAPQLKKHWALLQPESQHHAFLSWEWIGLWLKGVPTQLLVVEALNGDELVGVGLFCMRRVRKFGLFPTKQLWLNRCGEESLDQIWIEYNDCLLKQAVAAQVREAIYGYLFSNPELCDELYVGQSKLDIKSYLPKDKVGCRELMGSLGFRKNIARTSLDSLLASFSSNTRKQIKRSMKLLSGMGSLDIRPPMNKKEHDEWFSHMVEIHRQKWRDSEWGSGFDNPLFYNFHQTLIKEEGRAELLALMIDDQPKCFLYNLLDDKSVYFYLSAIPDEADNRIKLGLVAHTLAMTYYSDKGFEYYDFLAGESRYKKSLSDESYPMAFYCCYRKNWLSQLEQALRYIKQKLLRLTSK